jgi:acetyl esterase
VAQRGTFPDTSSPAARIQHRVTHQPIRAFDPEVLAAQALLREHGIAQGDAMTQPIDEARTLTRRFQAFLNGDVPAVHGIEEVVLDSATPQLRLRLYRPEAAGPLPAYLHIHGGGFAFGDLDSLDRWKREIANAAGVVVVGLEYALSPEHPYPTASDQVLAALRWLRDSATPHGVDGTRLAVGGDSAGGNLALGALLRLRDAGEAGPRLGAIIYGMLSTEHDTPSHLELGTGKFGLSTAKLEWFWSRYLPESVQHGGMGATPLNADLRGLPPLLLIAAGLDPLLDDTLSLDRHLTTAEVPHELRVYEGVPHGFIAQTRLLSKAREARDAVVAALRRHME